MTPPTPNTKVSPSDEMRRKFLGHMGCGLTVKGDHVWCDDPCASEPRNGCDCRDALEAALALSAQPSGHVGWPTVWGVGRDAENPKALIVSFDQEPSDEAIRNVSMALQPKTIALWERPKKPEVVLGFDEHGQFGPIREATREELAAVEAAEITVSDAEMKRRAKKHSTAAKALTKLQRRNLETIMADAKAPEPQDEGLVEALKHLDWIASISDMFFAECSQAEEVVDRAGKARDAIAALGRQSS